MNARRKFTFLLQLAVIALLIFSTAPVSADSPVGNDKMPADLESTARRLTRDLERDGYEVARGYFKLYTQSDCPYSLEVLNSCLGNNPAAPYVIPVLPVWPDEWVDPGTAGLVGPTEEGYNASYRLDPNEAILILGKLPPPAAYFSLQTYLLSRPGVLSTTSPQYLFVKTNVPALEHTFFTTLPKNTARLQLWADLSNSINNVVIENGSGSVWNKMRSIITTPDQTMDSAVRQALARLDIPDRFVFTQPIPSDVTIGLGEKADDFLTVIRYAMPADGGAEGTKSNAWRENPPLIVLRIRDTQSTHQPETYPLVVFEPRFGTTPPETALKPDLITLAKAVCARWGQPCNLESPAIDQRARPLLNMRLPPLLLTGPECMKVGMNCLAPTEDAAYFMSARLPLPDNRVYAVIGALGTQTGNATYVGLGLNASLTQLGFDNITDVELAGTADGYDVPNHEKLFLQYFARDCTGLETLTAGSQCYSIGDKLPACYDSTDLSCSMLVLSVRNYIFPGSQRGPSPWLTLNPRVIPLQRP